MFQVRHQICPRNKNKSQHIIYSTVSVSSRPSSYRYSDTVGRTLTGHWRDTWCLMSVGEMETKTSCVHETLSVTAKPSCHFLKISKVFPKITHLYKKEECTDGHFVSVIFLLKFNHTKRPFELSLTSPVREKHWTFSVWVQSWIIQGGFSLLLLRVRHIHYIPKIRSHPSGESSVQDKSG